MYFLALSQAPPEVFKKSAMRIPVTVANMSIEATTLAPRRGWPVAWPKIRKIMPADHVKINFIKHEISKP
jgi:hypothetical protein